MNYFPIKELTTWISRWTIKARIIDKTPMNQFKRADGQPTKVANIVIMDKMGDSIRAVFWGEAAEKWCPTLEQGKIYTFRNGRVQIGNRRFSSSNHPYELVFEKDADIQEVTEDESEKSENVKSIPMYRKSTFTKLREIKNSPRTLPFVVDLCVVLSWLSSNTETVTRAVDGIETVRRSGTVRDDTGHEMTLTFWGDFAENKEIMSAYEHRSDDHPIVLIIQNVQIREFRGRNGSTLSTSHVQINPEESVEAKDLMKWYIEEGRNGDFENLTEGGSQSSQFSTRGDQQTTICTLSEAFDKLQLLPVLGPKEPGELVMVIAEPMKFIYSSRTGETSLTFPGCPKCNRKCVGEEGSYRCESCDINVDHPNDKYFLGVLLSDISGARFLVRCFNDQAQTILGRTAEQMTKWVPHKCMMTDMANEASQLLDYDALWHRFRFRIRMKKEFYQGEERKNVTIASVEKLNFVVDARRMLNEIAEKLPNYTIQISKKRPEPPSEMQEQKIKRIKMNNSDESEGQGIEKMSKEI